MRAHAPAHPFLTQCQALLYAEAVLFIDDHQGEFLELHFFLKQRMGADHHGHTIGDLFQRAGAGLALEFAGQPGDIQTQWREPFTEIEKMLLGKNFGWPSIAAAGFAPGAAPAPVAPARFHAGAAKTVGGSAAPRRPGDVGPSGGLRRVRPDQHLVAVDANSGSLGRAGLT
ncbi:hypothetical protein DAPPUDRAFT_123584, partial [Daphnia pulex]